MFLLSGSDSRGHIRPTVVGCLTGRRGHTRAPWPGGQLLWSALPATAGHGRNGVARSPLGLVRAGGQPRVPSRTVSAFRGPPATAARSLGSHCQGHALGGPAAQPPLLRPAVPLSERPSLRKPSSVQRTRKRCPNPTGFSVGDMGTPAWAPHLGNHRWRAAKGKAVLRPHLP